MTKFTVGPFTVDIYVGGFPVWTQISDGRNTLHGIHHNDLADLKYAIEKAMRICGQQDNGKVGEEMGLSG